MKTSFRDSWRWLLGLYTLAAFIETIFWGQIAAFTLIFLKDIHISQLDIPRWIGVIAAITGLAGIPFLPFWGALADRYSRQPIIIRSFVMYLLAGAIAALAGNVWVFVIGRSLMSLSLGNSGLMMTTLSERTPSNRQGFAFAVMNSAGPIGAFVGPLLGGPIVDAFGFRTLMWIDVSLMIIIVLALSFGYHDSYRAMSQKPVMQLAVESLRVTFQNVRIRTLFIALFILHSGWLTVYAYQSLLVQSLYKGGDPASAIGYVLGGGGLCAFILAPFFGSLADRYGYWKILFIGIAIEISLWLVPFWTRELIPFAIVISLISGVSSAVFSISFNVLAHTATDDIRGRVMSFAYLPVNLGYLFGPILASRLVEIDLFYIFPAAFILTAIGLFALNLARKQSVSSNMAI